ncbi:hypothetical protein SY88_22755 [Clostridiales bacterium PH28_bin88]|nr:hypothetical protein SY88_22755 [Clostridiales bacterium PH28_bin88]
MRMFTVLLSGFLFLGLGGIALAETTEVPPLASFTIGKNTYNVNGQTRQMDVAPFTDNNGRTLVPVRFMAYALGIPEEGITWDSGTQTVTLTRDGVSVLLRLGNSSLYLDGKLAGNMDTAPVMKNGRVFLPTRYIAEAFSHAVTWDGDSQKVMVGAKGSGRGLSLKPQQEANGGTSGEGAVTDARKLVAVYRYSGGIMVGVEGKNWYLALSGGGVPTELTITDPNTGEKRTYHFSEDEWRKDPVIQSNNLAVSIDRIVKEMQNQKVQEEIRRAQEIEARRREQISPTIPKNPTVPNYTPPSNIQPYTPPRTPTVPTVPTIPGIPGR